MALLQISEPDIHSSSERKLAVGIDLGTTNSLVAISRNNQIEVFSNSHNSKLTPSVVHYGQNITEVGESAKAQQALDPANTIVSAKRFMGKSMADIEANHIYPYKFSKEGNLISIITPQGVKSPIEISSEILKSLKQTASNALDCEITDAVITVPAYFDDNQRQATKLAAKLANLEVLRLLNEPTAAAIAYGLDKNNQGNFLIYDLGGGTFDVSILRLHQGVFEVLAVNGNTALGGDDFDQSIYCYFIEKYQLKYLSINASSKLLGICKSIKEGLTVKSQVTYSKVKLDDLAELELTINRDEFTQITQILVNKTMNSVVRALADAKLSIADIDQVVLVGGATKMPIIYDTVCKFFNKQPLNYLDPEQVVAMGAAVCADMLSGNSKDDWLLLDVTPLSLGIETMGGLVEKIIPRNSTIPITKAQEFTTYKDGQTAMSIHVLQGEREMVVQCRSLAKFSLKGIPPNKAGLSKVRITFQIDADGLLTVSALETTTNIKSEIEIKPSFGLDEVQITKMIEDSISNAKDDVINRQLQEALIDAKQLIEMTENALKVDGRLLDSVSRTQIDQWLNKLKQLIDNQQIAPLDKSHQVKQLTQELNTFTTDFAHKQMDVAIRENLTGQNIDKFESK